MPHGHGLVQQTMVVDNTAIGSLVARTALSLNAAFVAIESTFLLKRVRYFLNLNQHTADDDGPLLVGIAVGDASLGEIATALLENNPQGPAELTQVLQQDNAMAVYQNTVRAFPSFGGRGAGASESTLDSGWINFGGKNGIPALEGSGFQAFAFNAAPNAMTTGQLVSGIIQVNGVWLRD